MTYSLVWLPQDGDSILRTFGIWGITGYMPSFKTNDSDDKVQARADLLALAGASLLALSNSKPVPLGGTFPIEKVRDLFEKLTTVVRRNSGTNSGMVEIILFVVADIREKYGHLAASDALYNSLRLRPDNKIISHDCIVDMVMAVEQNEVTLQGCVERIATLVPGDTDEDQLNWIRNETWHYFYSLSLDFLQDNQSEHQLSVDGITHPALLENLRGITEGKRTHKELFNYSSLVELLVR
jgi:hypothetical protein